MTTALIWLGIISGGICLMTVIFIWVYAPIRAKRLDEKYDQFRADFQSTHDEIDSQSNHQDKLVNGIQWHYVDEGARDGEVILFLHGLPEGWYSWRYVLPLVDHDYRLLAIDMKGYGRSDLHDEDYNWHHVASQTLDLMVSLEIKQFYVVSHDWGTIIGSVLVGDHPERIQGYVRMEADLIMEEKAAKPPLSAYRKKPQWLLFQNNWIASYIYRDAGGFIDFVYSKRVTSTFKKVDRDYLVYEYSRPEVAKMNPRYFQPKNWDLYSSIGKICKHNFPFPILQLQADSDPAQPKSIFVDMPSKCPNVQLQWVINAGHFDNFDQPEQVADAINKFVHYKKGPTVF